MDNYLSSANTIIGLVIAFAGACVWLGMIYSSHKALQEDVVELKDKFAELTDKFAALDKKMDHILTLLTNKISKQNLEFGD